MYSTFMLFFTACSILVHFWFPCTQLGIVYGRLDSFVHCSSKVHFIRLVWLNFLVVVRATAHLCTSLVVGSFEKYFGRAPHVVLRASHNLCRKGSEVRYW